MVWKDKSKILNKYLKGRSSTEEGDIRIISDMTAYLGRAVGTLYGSGSEDIL